MRKLEYYEPKFFEFYNARISFIEENCLKTIEGLILSCCCLDSLAGYCFGGKSSLDRFQRLIYEYSGNAEYWHRISLPLLKEHYNKNGKTKYSDLMRKFGVSEDNYLQIGYNVDISPDKIEVKAKNYNCVVLPFSEATRKEITDFGYSRVFWNNYRHAAIHEFLKYHDGPPHLFEEKNEVVYSHESVFDKSGNRIIESKINICFPIKFILKTLKDCLSNFKLELEKEKKTL